MKIILKLFDVKTFTASLLPVLFGSAYSLYVYGRINWLLTLLLAVALMSIQAATNMLNDYIDYRRGSDGADQADEKALVSGAFTAKQVLAFTAALATAALAIGIYIAVRTSWVVLLVAAAGAAVAVLYSAAPKPISHTPFGEAASGITMGFGITSTVVYIQSGQFTGQTLLMALPTAVYIAYIMFTNNLCDIEKDKSAGRFTLPARLGFEIAKPIWLLCCFVLILITVILIIAGVYPVWALLALLMVLNYRALNTFRLYSQEQFQKGKMMAFIGKLGIQYHLLMVAGFLIAYGLK